MSLRLARNNGKTMKTHMYKAVTVYSWDRGNVTLEDVSSSQTHEGGPMIPKRMKKQQVPREDARSTIPILKLATST